MPRDLTNLAPWVDWPRTIERIRKAKTDDKAIEILKHQLALGVKLFEGSTRREIEENLKVERIAALADQRVEAMAQAIALARDGMEAKWRDHLDEAKVIDAAIRARRRFEI